MPRVVGSQKKRKKVFVTIAEDILKEVDRLAIDAGTSRSAVISILITNYLRTNPKLDLPKGEKPKLKHFNVHEDHVTVMDEELGMLVDVYIRDKKLHCDYDLSDSCEHVEFVKNIEKVRKKLEKEGVDIKD